MYRFVTSSFVAAVLLIAASIAASAQSLPVPSYWTNQRGSEMKLYAIDPQGNFTGVYINHAAGFGCQNTPFALSGRATGANVTFRVVWQNEWQNCHSTTLWAGRVNGGSLPTDWVLKAPPSPPRFGKDLFTLQP